MRSSAVEIAVPFSPTLTQQDEFFHAGIDISILDSACGYSALSLMAPGMREGADGRDR